MPGDDSQPLVGCMSARGKTETDTSHYQQPIWKHFSENFDRKRFICDNLARRLRLKQLCSYIFSKYTLSLCNGRLKVGWYGMVYHTGSSLDGSKLYRHFLSEKHHSGVPQGQYGSQIHNACKCASVIFNS